MNYGKRLKEKPKGSLAKFSRGLAMAYHGKGYYAAVTGTKPKKTKIKTARTKATKRVMKSHYGVDWEKDKPTTKIRRRKR